MTICGYWCLSRTPVCCKVMVSIIKVTPLYILVSVRKKSYRPTAFGSLEPIIKWALCILFCRGDSVFLIGRPCGVWCRGLTHNRIAWIRQLYNTLVSALGIPIMSRLQLKSKRIYLHMKHTQKPVSIFPKDVLLPSHEILHFVAISHAYQIFKCVSEVTILSVLGSWHRHVVVSDTWFSFALQIVTHISSSPFHIGSFLCVQFSLFVIYQ